MLDESVIFNVVREEISAETGIRCEDVHQDSLLSDDLELYDEDLERVLVEVGDRLLSGESLVGNNAVVNCLSVRDLMDVIVDQLIEDLD